MFSKWNFLETLIQVCRGVSLLYFNFPFSIAGFLRISQRPRYQVKINEMVNIVFITTLVLQDYLKNTSFHTSTKFEGLYLSPECLLKFLSNLYIPPCLRKVLKFLLLTFLKTVLNLDILTHASSPQPKFSPKFHQKIWRWLRT